MKKRVGRTDNSRTILNNYDNEEPKSARRNQRCWQLWKFCKDLEPDDISVLITNRKYSLRYAKTPEEIKILRTDISILEDAYRIIKRKKK